MFTFLLLTFAFLLLTFTSLLVSDFYATEAGRQHFAVSIPPPFAFGTQPPSPPSPFLKSRLFPVFAGPAVRLRF